jgi:hypothetical protein
MAAAEDNSGGGSVVILIILFVVHALLRTLLAAILYDVEQSNRFSSSCSDSANPCRARGPDSDLNPSFRSLLDLSASQSLVTLAHPPLHHEIKKAIKISENEVVFFEPKNWVLLRTLKSDGDLHTWGVSEIATSVSTSV